MATIAERLDKIWGGHPGLAGTLTTVDHKKIGVRYIYTSFVFFVLAGIEAMIMRVQLADARLELLDPETYNQLFSMHGITMIFLFVTPMLSGFGNYFVPLMLGTRDMAFPRLNAFSYWVYLFAGIFLYSSFLIGQAPNDGWFNYVPLASNEFTPDLNIDFYALGITFLGISSTAGAINFIVTILKMRAPGMSLNRMPLYCWAILSTSFIIVFAIPSLTAGNILLELDRKFGFQFFNVDGGGDPLLWQHLFWFFGHPDVYLILLPAVGIVSAIVPVFSRRRMVGYTYVALATVGTAIISFGVWVHHMFATGLPQLSLSFFSAASMLVTIPSSVQIFAWLATMLRGKVVITTASLYVMGFLFTFVVGGLTGIMFGVIPFDQQVTDSYFVVAHFHYTLFGGAVFPIFAGFYHWLPKITGRRMDERLGKWSFWLFFLGFNLLFFPMHIAGLLGMPRRVYTYEAGLGWEIHNLLATIGGFVLAVGILLTAINYVRSLRRGADAGDDPWEGETLEWATTSPPPDYNFPAIPTVRSSSPLWDQDELRGGQPPDKGGYELADGHAVVLTSPVEAKPEAIVHMPHASPWPFILSLFLFFAFVGVLTDMHALAAAAGVLSACSIAGWLWPRGETQET